MSSNMDPSFVALSLLFYKYLTILGIYFTSYKETYCYQPEHILYDFKNKTKLTRKSQKGFTNCKIFFSTKACKAKVHSIGPQNQSVTSPLPPTTNNWNRDEYYLILSANELVRTITESEGCNKLENNQPVSWRPLEPQYRFWEPGWFHGPESGCLDLTIMVIWTSEHLPDEIC